MAVTATKLFPMQQQPIRTVEDANKIVNELIVKLDERFRQLQVDLDNVHRIGEWRIIESGDDFVFERKISGVWTEGFRIKGS